LDLTNELVNEPILVAITGATSSGKSTFSQDLCKRLQAHSPVLLNQDRYFRDFRDVPKSGREAAVTSNHPRAVLWDELITHLGKLKAGQPVSVPVSGTRAQMRGDAPSELGPSMVIILEGHLIFNEPRVVELSDLLVFVDANVHERAVRRLLRDTASGKTSLEKATAWYRRDVIPNVAAFSEAKRDIADLIIPFDQDNGLAAQILADWITKQVERLRGPV
jgi:uridine kinase